MSTIPRFTTSFTNLGPLPTTSFPADCLSELWDLRTTGLGLPWTYNTQGCAVSTCCPSDNAYTEGWAWMTSYYSPGVCPSQYRSCRPPAMPTALSSSQGETVAFCCPTNYDCPNVSDFVACFSLLSTSTSVIVLNNLYDQKTVSTRPFSLDSVAMSASYQIAYPIQVRSRLGETIPTASFPTATDQSGGNPNDAPGGSGAGGGGLSTGAIIGLSFGVFFAVALVVSGVLFFLYKVRWAARKEPPIPTDDDALGGQIDPSATTPPVAAAAAAAKTDYNGKPEMMAVSVSPRPPELDAQAAYAPPDSGRFELPISQSARAPAPGYENYELPSSSMIPAELGGGMAQELDEMDVHKLDPNDLPHKRLYRVQYDESMTGYDVHDGLEAEDTLGNDDFKGAVKRHLNWDRRRSMFISLFSDKRHAENWLWKRRSTNGKILEIDPTQLEYIYRAQDLVNVLRLKVRDEAQASIPHEYLVAHWVPPQAIISCHTIDEIERARGFRPTPADSGGPELRKKLQALGLL
ncbi:hypothetical protein FQN55_000783 [Onygenales sp. PD_40]|nr:hypothetical protein FQN55_000783 [Onygenales sp. PD_40]